MKKVLIFSLLLVLGLVLSQILPYALSVTFLENSRSLINILLCICLSYIMINVGREFVLDKKQWRSYTADYFIAMTAAALPWLLVCIYYMVLLPKGHWGDWDAWKNNLLLSRFTAPTSAGILFSMLAAIGLKKSWVYQKIQTLAIFDDLDTILLMIPLQVMMIGLRWELFIIIFIVVGLLIAGWSFLNKFNLPQHWYSILFYAVLVALVCQAIHHGSMLISDQGVHIEVLLPAFVFGMMMKPNAHHLENESDEKKSSLISYIFMFLVGLSMPLFIGSTSQSSDSYNLIPSMPWWEIGIHVVIVSLLSNIGKLVPLFFYKGRKISERLALSIGMFTRGEVGAGIIFIAIGYNIGGPLLIISVLTLVLNLLLTGFFIVFVKKLTLRSVGRIY